MIKIYLIECYLDVSLANLPDEDSQGASIIFIKEEKCQQYSIYWWKRKNLTSCQINITWMPISSRRYQYYSSVRTDCMIDKKRLVDALHSSKGAKTED